jgi:hypothetical protein
MNKVQEALKAANKWFDDGLPSHDMPAVITAIKSALSDIEKCEPVGWYCKACKETGLSHCSDPVNCGGMVRTYTSPQPIGKCEPVAWMTNREDVIEQFGTMAITNAHKNSLVLAEQIIADLFDIPLYTSPISKEWVRLSDSDCDAIREEARDMLVDNDTLRIAEAKLKQLNTAEKG